MLPDASGLSCVSVPVLTRVGVDTRSRKAGIGPGVLKGLWVIFSNWLRKDGRTRGLGVATKMGSGVGPKGSVGNSLIHSAAGSSGPVCTVSIRAGCAVVSAPKACLSTSPSSLTTSSTMVLTATSVGAGDVRAVRVLDEGRSSSSAGTSSSQVDAEVPVRALFNKRCKETIRAQISRVYFNFFWPRQGNLPGVRVIRKLVKKPRRKH